MEYIYAVMLLHKAGKPINEASVRKVLDAAGVKADDARLNALVSSLDGVDIEKVVKEASFARAAAPATAEAKEEKKQEKKAEEKPSEEQAAAGLSALFG